MSKFLHHTSCDSCGSSDANGVFDDGHTFCWSCQKHVRAKIHTAAQVSNILLQDSQVKNILDLPIDISKSIPKLAYTWLKGYGVTNEEIVKHNLMWSDSRQMLIFPFYGDNNEIMLWQGRYFPARNPKVFTSGYPDNHIIFRPVHSELASNRVVVVEDSVSAIKVSRLENAMELLGSNLSMQRAIRLSKVFSHLTLWLDSDKYKSACKFADQYGILYSKVDVIYTEKDPKEYSTDELKHILFEKE